MTTIIEEAQSQRRSEAASRPKKTRPAHHTRVSIVRWYVSSHAGMCGRTRRAKRRSKGDSSDELDFVAIAYCSLCISKTPSRSFGRASSQMQGSGHAAASVRPCRVLKKKGAVG